MVGQEVVPYMEGVHVACVVVLRPRMVKMDMHTEVVVVVEQAAILPPTLDLGVMVQTEW